MMLWANNKALSRSISRLPGGITARELKGTSNGEDTNPRLNIDVKKE